MYSVGNDKNETRTVRKMKISTLFIGLNDKDLHKQVITEEKAVDTIQNIVLKTFDGCSVYKVNGVYKQERENTIAVEIAHNRRDASKLRSCVATLKQSLNQESILIKKSNCSFM